MSCTGPAGLPRPKKEPGRRRGALRRSSSRHSHGEREKKRWVFLSVFLCFCLSFFRSFFFAPSPFLLLLLLLLLFFASSSLLGDQPFAAGTSSAWLHGALGGAPARPTQEPPSVSVFPWRPHSPLTHPRTRAALTRAQDLLPSNPVTVKDPTKESPPSFFCLFFLHPSATKATVFFPPIFASFFFFLRESVYITPQEPKCDKNTW